jgi:tetratricopeptide (TPR) repeat protein
MKKYFPVLLLITIILFFVTDHLKPDFSDNHDHQEHNGHDDVDHSDPENIRRMAIFHFNEGNKFLQQKNWAEAIKNYHKALNHNREIQETYVNLSTAYLKAEKYEEALDTLHSLATINPSAPLLHYNLACYYSLTENMQESLSALKKAVDLGYKSYSEIQTDPDLENLINNAKFKTWFQSIGRDTGN